MELYGSYDVVIVGAGISGVCASIKAQREGAKTLLVEGSGVLGGLITGGRQTKSTGLINGGIFQELLDRCVAYKGADPEIRSSYWGKYSGQFDAEVMQRVIVEVVEEAGVEILLYAPVTDAIKEGRRVKGIKIQAKSGPKLILGKVFIDCSGDGDLAVLAGAESMVGRKEDGLTQPISSRGSRGRRDQGGSRLAHGSKPRSGNREADVLSGWSAIRNQSGRQWSHIGTGILGQRLRS